MAMLATGILLLANSWNGSYMRLRKTQYINEVAALLERKMIEVRMEFDGKPLDSIPEEKEDDFGSDFPKYRWKLESRDLEIPDLSGTLTAREGGADQMLISVIKQLTEHLSKSIKEVKVTVIYKGDKKDFQYSATTYFVDYNKELPLPGGSGGTDAGTTTGTAAATGGSK